MRKDVVLIYSVIEWMPDNTQMPDFLIGDVFTTVKWSNKSIELLSGTSLCWEATNDTLQER